MGSPFEKNSLQSKVRPHLHCPHVGKNSNRCSISELTDTDVESFARKLYNNKTAVSQNQFVAQYIVPYLPTSHRPCSATPRKRTQNQYFI